MTTGGLPGEPGERQAAGGDAAPLPDAVPVSAADDTAAMTAAADAEPVVPDDVQGLRQEIGQTRDQLGQTVEQLAVKGDVKSRARAKAAGLAGRVKTGATRTRDQAAARAGSARGQLAGTVTATRRKAIAAGQAGTGQLQRRAAAVRQHPVPVAIAVAGVVVACLAIRQRRKR